MRVPLLFALAAMALSATPAAADGSNAPVDESSAIVCNNPQSQGTSAYQHTLWFTYETVYNACVFVDATETAAPAYADRVYCELVGPYCPQPGTSGQVILCDDPDSNPPAGVGPATVWLIQAEGAATCVLTGSTVQTTDTYVDLMCHRLGGPNGCPIPT